MKNYEYLWIVIGMAVLGGAIFFFKINSWGVLARVFSCSGGSAGYSKSILFWFGFIWGVFLMIIAIFGARGEK